MEVSDVTATEPVLEDPNCPRQIEPSHGRTEDVFEPSRIEVIEGCKNVIGVERLTIAFCHRREP